MGRSSSASAAAPPPAGDRRPLDRARGLTGGAVIGLTALSALVAALIGLAFDLWPALRPDPGTALDADVRVLAVERNVTFGESMRRRSASEEEYRRWRAAYVRDNGPGGLTLEGELMYVQLGVRGFKGRSVTLGWAVYDARSKARIDAGHGSAQQTRAVLDAPTDEFIVPLWMDPVDGPGRYFVRVEVRSGRTLLAMSDSAPFPGRPG